MPIDGVEMRVVDDDGTEMPQGEVGEIAIRGHNVMKGYWRRPEATAEAIDPAGWFQDRRPRPRGRRRHFYIVDRTKDMIIRGGYNVYPREIEELLYEHPAVREAAVIGIPHPELGEESRPPWCSSRTPTTAGELRDHVKGQIAAYKYPRRLARRRTAEGPDGQDPQARDLGAGLRDESVLILTSAASPACSPRCVPTI